MNVIEASAMEETDVEAREPRFIPGLGFQTTFKEEPFNLVVELVYGPEAWWLPNQTEDGRAYWSIDFSETVLTIDGPRRSAIDSYDNQRWRLEDGDELVIRDVYRLSADAVRAIHALAAEVGCRLWPTPPLSATPPRRPSALSA